VVGGATVHGAAGQALGYLYQSYVPLVELARRAPADPELVVRLELLDDVEFESGDGAKELLQTKHHINAAASLSDSSADLWRSVNAWMTAVEATDGEEIPTLTLFTTANAPDGTAAYYLGADRDQRDPQRALTIFRATAVSSVNATTAPWRARFGRLTQARQAALLSAMVVADGRTRIDGLDEELFQALHWVLPSPEHRGDFIDHVKGWWLGIAIRLLLGEIPAFSAIDMLGEIGNIRDQYGPENLPTDPELPDPDADEIVEYEGRSFVRQLRLIAATDAQLSVAIRDCYRAFTQRSRWLRRELIGVGEVDRFEERLVEDWRFLFTNLTAELTSEASEDQRVSCGREVFARAAETAKARIRAKYEEGFMTRGSLHLLAEDSRVGWHPDFEARMQELLEPVVEGE
jgi:hypothetical protein